MTGATIHLAVAAAFWFGIHAGVSGSPLRWRLVARIGERAFTSLFALLSAGGVTWLIFAYVRAPYEPLWTAGAWSHWLAVVLMPVVFLLAVCAFSSPNPTALGQDLPSDPTQAVRGIARVTRHPFLWAVTLWSMLHLLASGHLGAVLFFGSMALTALVGGFQIDAKRQHVYGEKWAQVRQVSSNLPFAAILGGRNRFVAAEIGWVRLLVALALYGGFLAGHPYIFGSSALPAGGG